MATMGATISPYFSKSSTTTTTTTSCISSKHISSDFVLRIPCMRTLQVASISHSHSLDSLSISPISHKSRISRISAAVAQEEEVSGSIEEKEEDIEATEEEEEEDALNTKLYFGNLPYNCDSAQLAGIIQDYASPEMVEVLYDRDTGRSRGYAFVTMSSMEDANAVIQNLDGSDYGGRTLRVNFSDKPKPKEPLYPETEHKLFVGNLSWSVTAEILTQAFEEHGNVVGARVLYDGETGRSRGYGFVCYSSKLEMEAALESLHGVQLEGREMRVSLAQGKRSYK